MDNNEVVDGLVRMFIARGQVIEAGFVAYRLLVLPDDAPQVQIDECRFAFMAGAQHLFGSITSTISPGVETTAADIEAMRKIAAELDAFTEEMCRRIQ